MSTIKSSDEHLTLNADGSSKDIKFQANGVEKASISSAGAFTSTTIDATKLTGDLPAISGASLTGITASDNTPAFEVYMSANLTGIGSSHTKMPFNTESFDTDSAWDTTNYKFTVPSGEGGKYVFYANTYMSGQGGDIGDYSEIHIYKNGSDVAYNYTHIGNHSTSNNISRILTLSAGDYVEFYVMGTGGTYTAYTSNNLERTVAYGYKLAGV